MAEPKGQTDKQIEELLKAGAFPAEVADVIRKGLQTPANVKGEPLPEDEALDGWEITPADMAQAQADWVATAPEWAAGLLDAKPMEDQPQRTQRTQRGKGSL